TKVTHLRSRQSYLIDQLSADAGCIVRHDRIAFTQEHRDSFDTLYTALKATDGGKGFGRFTCLKYFHNLTVESVFQDGAARKKRSFTMGTGNDIVVDDKVTDAGDSPIESAVTISVI